MDNVAINRVVQSANDRYNIAEKKVEQARIEIEAEKRATRAIPTLRRRLHEKRNATLQVLRSLAVELQYTGSLDRLKHELMQGSLNRQLTTMMKQPRSYSNNHRTQFGEDWG